MAIEAIVMENSSSALSWAHPLVREWFTARFGSPTEPQEQGWPSILSGQTTLISAPTGSGKTLAAFLACIDSLVRQAVSGKLENRTQVLYVSPLKALSNDIQKNLEVPLAEITELAKTKGIEMQTIRAAVRTGDTLAYERQQMIKTPPHILVTTPESLYILLTATKSRKMLADVETVIVDEIHAVADDKRGAHLALSLERLQALCERPLVRIGLSATQKPIELIAGFLEGSGKQLPTIIQVGHKRQMDLAVEVPLSPLAAVASNEMWDEIYNRIAVLVEEHRSTLVFVNTRKLAERLSMHLTERLGEEAVACHHGSLSRKLRHQAEHKLKAGEIKVLVATASLELGIDIGFVDLVCQISSPRAIAACLQRVGRAGHWRGAIPKGRVFATTRDELVECAALVQAISEGELDQIIMPKAPLDILAQQIVATAATNEWMEEELFKLVTSAYPYKQLPRGQFDQIIEMLSEGFQGRSVRFGAYLHRDRINGKVKGRRGAQLAAITNGGAIPETGLFSVVAEPDGKIIGTLDEDFSVESNAGDIILLGNTSWRIRRVETYAGRVLVEDAHGAPPSVPFWRGEAPARTIELSTYVSNLRQAVSDMLPSLSLSALWQEDPSVKLAVDWLLANCGLSVSAAEQIIEYVITGRAVLGAVPTKTTVIAERFFDESGGMQLIIHSPFGGRINKAWGLALRKRFCVGFNLELQAAATEDGLNISLSEHHSFPLSDVFFFLNTATVKEVLEQAILQSPIFNSRWRWDTTRALSVLRFSGGKKVPPQIQRMRAEDLLGTVFPQAAACQDNIVGDIVIPQHPLIDEVMKDIFEDALDLEGLKEVIEGIAEGKITAIAVDTPVPSVFSHEILNANPYAYLDDAPLEERRARAVEMRRVLPVNILEEIGRLDPQAIDQVVQEAYPDLRDADELHDFLLTIVAMPENASINGREFIDDKWREFFSQLKKTGRAACAEHGGITYWLAAESKSALALAFPDAVFDRILPEFETAFTLKEQIIITMLKGWLMHLGPVTPGELEAMLGLSVKEVELALLALETSGAILRGHFKYHAGDTIEWCDRRLLARIHKLTIGALRKAIEPVSAAQFYTWLARWQHVTPGSQLAGEFGLLQVITQLQGFEAPANAWETSILKKRLTRYDGRDLDKLCLSGAVGWGRLSPHPATIKETTKEDADGKPATEGSRRVIPTSNAPITFFIRSDCTWMVHKQPEIDKAPSISHAAKQVFDSLRKRGASFFADLVRATSLLKSEVETALWELVTAGLITADGFDNLRSLIDPKRRSGQGRARQLRPRNNAGRWAVLYTDDQSERFKIAEAACWMLLNRYGIVFRDLIQRESVVPSWRELLMSFRRLEDRGEIRGGRFVSGFLGEQFALPDAVESLRVSKSQVRPSETVTISASDPLNLVGIIIAGERLSSLSAKFTSITDGITVSY
jgi:ATP-dependent Lhr-like helicase